MSELELDQLSACAVLFRIMMKYYSVYRWFAVVTHNRSYTSLLSRSWEAVQSTDGHRGPAELSSSTQRAPLWQRPHATLRL